MKEDLCGQKHSNFNHPQHPKSQYMPFPKIVQMLQMFVHINVKIVEHCSSLMMIMVLFMSATHTLSSTTTLITWNSPHIAIPTVL